MQIVILQENLLSTINQATRFVSTKPQIPILSGILLKAQKGKLLFRSTDLRVGFQTTLPVKVEEEGEVVVPAKIFAEFLSTLSPGAMEIKTDVDQLVVAQKKTKVKIPTFPSAEFPPFPEVSGEEVELPLSIFTDAIQSVLYTASLDETRPVLASLNFSLEDDELICACTDGYRLSVMKQKTKEKTDKKMKMLLPAKSMQELMNVFKTSGTKKVTLSVSQELSQTFITVDEVMILIRLVEGEFPPYERIIPSSFAFETMLDREEFLGALKTAMVFARESSQVINLEFSDSLCRVKSASTGAGEQEGEVSSSKSPDEPKRIAFNGRFLIDVLNHLESEKVIFKMNDELKPGVLLPEDKDYPLSVIMPFKR